MPEQNPDEALIISGGTVQGLIHENYGTVTQNFITQIADGIVDRGRPINSTKTRQQLRQRSVLLGKVKEYWIKGVLERSLNHELSLDLVFENRTDLVERPFVEIDHISSASPEEAALGMSDAIQFYGQLGEGRTLLILGEPGGGKTMTLLKLADNLIKTAEKDSDALIPVIFNLSSWSTSSDLEVWLLEELQTKYGVSKGIGQELLANEELILMLDGLDEVRLNDRDACVSAMNHFLLKHGQTEMVACCRLLEYQSLVTHLQVREAILIHQLTDAQVARYLELAGDNLKSLRKLLQEDDQLRGMARNPLMLSIMALAYSGHSSDDDDVLHTGASNRKQHLFDVYINRMLAQQLIGKPSSYKTPYGNRQLLRWLSWMARQMKSQSQTIFLIESLQPFNLGNRRLQLAYVVLYAGLASFLVSIVPFIGFGPDLCLYLLLVLIVTSIITLQMYPRLAHTSATKSRLNPDSPPDIKFAPLRMVKHALIPFRSLYAVLYTLYLQNLFDPKIIPIYAAQWSLKQALRFARDTLLPILLFLSLSAFGPVLLLKIPGIKDNHLLSLLPNIVSSTAGIALIIFIIFFLFPSFMLSGIKISTDIKETSLPNQGIRTSMLSTPLLTLIGAISSMPLVLLLFFLAALFCFNVFSVVSSEVISQISINERIALFEAASICKELLVSRIWILQYVLAAGASLAVFPASPCLKHLSLRLLLAFAGLSPFNYSRFLDYSASRLFLRKVGGGYIFVHRDLLEHFAAM